mmetsp:Transcript_6667/g.17437  ORF Transcript_6667/g.17437 Transcript_6667/m.17437 type:complete len:259 (-) Transcript_6667:35-811(-)
MLVGAIIVPLVIREGLGYLERGGGLVLVDSGASRSILDEPSLEDDDEVARAARRCSPRPTREVALPEFCRGILGFDALRELASEGPHRRVEFDFVDGVLRVNEPAERDVRRCPLADDPFPLVDCQVFGLASCDVAAVVDTGSPVTIANRRLADLAGLTDDDGARPIETRNADGSVTGLVPKTAFGLRVADVDRPNCRIYVGDLPAMALVDRPVHLLLGLDVLGTRFALEAVDDPPATRKKKSRRVVEPPRRRLALVLG